MAIADNTCTTIIRLKKLLMLFHSQFKLVLTSDYFYIASFHTAPACHSLLLR